MPDRVHEAAAQYSTGGKPLRVEEFFRAVANGLLGPRDRVELLEGQIVAMSPQSPRHAAVTSILRERLAAAAPTACLREHSPIVLGDLSAPEPDVVVAQGPCERYLERHPHAQDIWLVVEVSDSSLARDRTLKARLYAEHGIPEYWLVDLAKGVVEVFRTPSAGVYASSERIRKRSLQAALQAALDRRATQADSFAIHLR